MTAGTPAADRHPGREEEEEGGTVAKLSPGICALPSPSVLSLSERCPDGGGIYSSRWYTGRNNFW